jgi:pyruvate dehydrogenase E2 component (dihydrolipoamide acetyltransferase)
MPSDPPLVHARVGGGRVAYTEEGAGRVVLALHGLPGSHRDFRWLGSALGGRVRLIRPDLPGFGRTPLEVEPRLGVVERASVVPRLLDALGVERAHLVGHSMGGPVAVCAALLAPDRVLSLTLLASPGLRPHRGLRRFPARSFSALLRVPLAARALSPAIALVYRRAGFPASQTDAERINALHAVARVDFAAHAARLRALSLPTAVAWADDDRLVEAEISEEIARVVPAGPRLHWLDGGHNIQKTRAVELAQALVGWWR